MDRELQVKLLDMIKAKRESAQNDYTRFMQRNENAYKDDMLICRGEIMAYMDLESMIKNMEVKDGV